MEALEEQGFSEKKLQLLNRCRIYLQILTLSDLMNGFGNGFTSLFKCQSDHQHHNSFKWPHQPEPSTSMKNSGAKHYVRRLD